MNLNTNGLADWEADLVRNEPLLEKHMAGQDWRWVRYPYPQRGRDAREARRGPQGPEGPGYRIASVTMSFGDYAWNEPYARCMAKGDAAAVAVLEASYLEAAKDSLDFERALSAKLYGRDIPYVLLMHAGGLRRADDAEAAEDVPGQRRDVRQPGGGRARQVLRGRLQYRGDQRSRPTLRRGREDQGRGPAAAGRAVGRGRSRQDVPLESPRDQGLGSKSGSEVER